MGSWEPRSGSRSSRCSRRSRRAILPSLSPGPEPRSRAVEQALDESSRWPDDVCLIVMLRFDYDLAEHAGPGTAPKPPEQVAARGADRSIMQWWTFLFL